MTPATTILIFIAIASAGFGSMLWVNGINGFKPNPNKKAALACFLVTLAAFAVNILLHK